MSARREAQKLAIPLFAALGGILLGRLTAGGSLSGTPAPATDPGQFSQGYPAAINPLRVTGKDLRGADLEGTGFRDANLAGVDLRGALLSHADLAHANLAYAKLGGATLESTLLVGANLSHADLAGANLNGADLRGARLDGATLRGADLRAARYSPTTRWPSGFNPRAHGAILAPAPARTKIRPRP